MVTRPDEYTTWASDETQVVEPAGGLKATGWTPGDAPPAQYFNWLFWLGDQWTQWLDQITQELQYRKLARAVLNPFSTGNILSSSHVWNACCVSNPGSDPSLAAVRYWVVGDDGAGDTAIAYADGLVSGGSWADETGSAQGGSLNACAAQGTLCMGVGGVRWKLGGSTNEFGTHGATIYDITWDATNSLWVMGSSAGIYTSPATSVTWTLRQAGGFHAVWYDRETETNYAILYAAGDIRLYRSTDGTSWTASTAIQAVAGLPVRLRTCATEDGLFLSTDAGELFRITDVGETYTDITPAGPDPEGIFVWNDILTIPGMYFSHGAADDQWRGARYVLPGGAVVDGGDHGALLVAAGASATLFGPTPRLDMLPYAV